MQCLSIVDPSIAEEVLAQLRSIDAALEVTPYAGGSLQRRRYDLVVVASHLNSRGILLGGDNYLSPLALGSLAETAKAAAIFVASCDGPTIAMDIAGQAKSAAIVYYGAALDPDTAQRLAVSFAERYCCEGPAAAVSVAQAAGYQVLNPIWKPMASDGGFGGNSEMTRLLLEMQRSLTETQSDVRYLREDMTTVKAEVRRINDAQVAQGMPLRNIMAVVSAALVVVVLGWMAVYLLSGRGL